MNEYHSFNTQDAAKHGMEKAIILQHIRYWLTLHKAGEKHIYEYDGQNYYWTFFTANTLYNIFPYMKSEQKIHRLLRELVKDKILLTQVLSTNPFDRTRSYTIKAEYALQPPKSSNFQKSNIEVQNIKDGTLSSETCTRSNITRSNNPSLLDNKKQSLPPTTIQEDPLPEKIPHRYLLTAQLSGFSGDLDNEYFQFLGHLQATNRANYNHSRKHGEWQRWIGKATIIKANNQAKKTNKQSPHYDPLGINDTTWRDQLNDEIEKGDSF